MHQRASWNLQQCTCPATDACAALIGFRVHQSFRRHATKPVIARRQCRLVVNSVLPPQAVFNTVTLAVMPVYALMVAFPRKPLTKAVVSSPVFYAAGSLVYLASLLLWGREGLLGSIWEAGRRYFADAQGCRKRLNVVAREGAKPLRYVQHAACMAALACPAYNIILVAHIAALFESPSITALAWTHLLLLDLCVARNIYLDGLKKEVITAHSIVLCFMFGPTGLLSHMLTARLSRASKGSSRTAQQRPNFGGV